MDVDKKKQLCYKGVHLLLFQKSLHREVLTDAKIHGNRDLCDGCLCRLSRYLPALSNCYPWPSQRWRCLWAASKTLCLIRLCVCNFKVAQKTVSNIWWTKEECAAMCDNNCHLTLAEDSHVMVVFTLSSRAHSLSVFLVLPMVLPVLQTDFLVLFSAEASLKDQQQLDLKREALTDEAKNSSWILRSGWTTLRINVFESDALLCQPSLIPYCWWHSQA